MRVRPRRVTTSTESPRLWPASARPTGAAIKRGGSYPKRAAGPVGSAGSRARNVSIARARSGPTSSR
jgi:hypothetical protein